MSRLSRLLYEVDDRPATLAEIVAHLVVNEVPLVDVLELFRSTPCYIQALITDNHELSQLIDFTLASLIIQAERELHNATPPPSCA
jgi:hypothetical protein